MNGYVNPNPLMFKKANAPVITSSSPSKISNENAPPAITSDNLTSKSNFKKDNNTYQKFQPKPLILEEPRHQGSVAFQKRQNDFMNSSNVPSESSNHVSIREFHNKDMLDDRFPSDFKYMENEIHNLDKSETSYETADGMKRILPSYLLSPDQLSSFHFQMSPTANYNVDMFTQSTIKGKHSKFSQADKFNFRLPISVDKGEHISEIFGEGKEISEFDSSADSSFVHLVNYLSDQDREKENIPSTPREQAGVEGTHFLTPNKSYFSRDKKESKTTSTTKPPLIYQISDIKSDIFKQESSSQTPSSYFVSFPSSQVHSTREEAKQFTDTGKVKAVLVNSNSIKTPSLQLETVTEGLRENDLCDPNRSKGKVKAKFKIKGGDLSSLLGKKGSFTKSLSELQTLHHASTESICPIDKENTEVKNMNTKMHTRFPSVGDPRYHQTTTTTELKQTFQQIQQLKDYFMQVKTMPDYNSGDKWTPEKLQAKLLNSQREVNYVPDGNTEVIINELTFKDCNNLLEQYLQNLQASLESFKRNIHEESLLLHNYDLTKGYIEVAIQRTEDVLKNNDSLPRLMIDTKSIQNIQDFIKPYSNRPILKNILTNLTQICHVSLEKEKLLERLRAEMTGVFSSKMAANSVYSSLSRTKPTIPKLTLEDIYSNRTSPEKKKSIIFEVKNMDQRQTVPPRSGSTQSQFHSHRDNSLNEETYKWILKKMSFQDYQIYKDRFAKIFVECKDDLPPDHPGKEALATTLFEEVIMNDVPEDKWNQYIFDRLFTCTGASQIFSKPSTFRHSPCSIKECHF